MCNYCRAIWLEPSILNKHSNSALITMSLHLWFCASKSISCFSAWYLHMIAPWFRKQFNVSFPQKDFSKVTLTWQSKLSSEPLTRKSVCTDDLKQQWWRHVKWWLRVVLMTFSQLMSSNDDLKERWTHFSRVMSVSDVKNFWWNDEETWCERWLQHALISCCFRKMRAKLCKQKESDAQIFWSLFEQTFLQQRNFFIASLYASTWIKIVRVYSTN